jgi:cytochrome c oxidase assembly protein subunit 15
VILQGVLGGLTVKFFLPAPVSIAHAGLAQIFFALTVGIALFTSSSWRNTSIEPVDDPGLRKRLVLLTGTVYAQILLGATMRHTGAGLAIPDFPLSFGHIIPPIWTPQIAVHFAHRIGALAIAVLILVVTSYIFTRHRDRRELTRAAWLLIAAVVTQITLGAFVVLTLRQEVVNTFHVATGALVFGTSVVLTLRSFRVRFAVGTRTSLTHSAIPSFTHSPFTIHH